MAIYFPDNVIDVDKILRKYRREHLNRVEQENGRGGWGIKEERYINGIPGRVSSRATAPVMVSI